MCERSLSKPRVGCVVLVEEMTTQTVDQCVKVLFGALSTRLQILIVLADSRQTLRHTIATTTKFCHVFLYFCF